MTRPLNLTFGHPLSDTITVEDDAGVATDPDSLTIRYRRKLEGAAETVIDVPDPQAPPAGVERLSEGVFRATLDLPEVGAWVVRWESVNPKTASEREVCVVSVYPGIG